MCNHVGRILAICVVFAGLFPAMVVAGQHSLGAGIHYLVTVDAIDAQGFDEDSVGYILSYQWTSGFTSLELDFEYFPERFGGFEDSVWAPQAFLVLGSNLYGALGIGKYYENDDWSEAFYVLRLGLDIPILESLSIDLNANYQFNDFDQIQDVDKDVDTDTITLGTMVRYRF